MAQPRDPRAYAVQMLAELAKKGHDVSPHDGERVQLYMQLRGQYCTANDRLTPKLFYKWRVEAQEEARMSASTTLRALGVPRSQFPNGLPEYLKATELLPDELEEPAPTLGVATLIRSTSWRTTP